jgi:hypothetical protein
MKHLKKFTEGLEDYVSDGERPRQFDKSETENIRIDILKKLIQEEV